MMGKCAGLCALLWLALGDSACAQTLVDERLPLGAPPREVSVELTLDGDSGAYLQVGKRRFALPDWLGLSAAEARAIALPGGASALQVVGRSAAGELQAWVGGARANRLLLSAPVGLRGDPGERAGLEVTLEAVDGGTRVRMRRRAEALAHCDGTPLWLESRELDAERLTLVPAAASPDVPAQAVLDAKPVDALVPPSPLRMLRPAGSTDAQASGPQVPPAQLDDGNRATAVMTQGPATRIFWRGHAAATGIPVERLEFAAPEGGRLPARLRVELGPQRAVDVKLDPAAPLQAVELTEPLALACISLAAAGPFRGRVGVGEFRAVTALHGPEPAKVLAEALAKDDASSSAAARLLARLGAAGAQAAVDVWPQLSELGRRRALPVLAPFLGEATVLAAVREAATQPGLLEPAVQVLLASEEAGREVLTELASREDAVGAAALEALGQTAGNAVRLLSLLAAEGGASRPRLRAALTDQARVDAEGTEAAARRWLDGASPVSRAALAQAVAGTGPRSTPVVQQACEGSAFVPEAGFEERYRCALALAREPAGPAGDTWLSGQAKAAAEWMQRREALVALSRRGSPGASDAANEALQDDTPRVREQAATALRDAGATPALRALAERDPWPAVRRAAVEALADDGEARVLLRRRVDDPSRRVREAAIGALTSQEDRDAWPTVAKRLEKQGEFPEVRVAAIRFAGELCVAPAAPALRKQLERGLGPDAEASDTAVAIEALRALRRLGGDPRAQAEQWLEQAGAPAGLGRAAGEPARCPPGSSAGTPTS